MQRCFDLAELGAGNVAPNPLVGAVIVYDSKIIGEGFHAYYGGPHAEVNAVNSVGNKEKKLLPFSTLYVNLEPCSHHGKTPPCTELILKTGIKKVIIANRDIHPLVNGKGMKRLRKAGCSVQAGVLKEQGEWLNRRFFTYHRKKRPYIILKWAQSADGFFTKDSRKQHWLTGEQSRMLVHRWRSEEAAIMAGTNTVRIDNPRLTNRLWMSGRQPVRIIIDRNLTLPRNLNVFDTSAPTVVFTARKSAGKKNIRYVQLTFGNDFLQAVMRTLFEMQVQSVMVEGGAKLLAECIRQNLWDEARIFTAEKFWGAGTPAPALEGKIISHKTVGNDLLRILINENN